MKKFFTKSFTINFHQTSKHELVTSVEDYMQCLTSCRFVDCHVKVVDNLE